MAVLTVQTPTAVGSTLTYAAVAGGGDSFAALSGARYLLLFRNTGGAGSVPTVDDPTSATPVGATTFNPDMAGTSVPATTGVTAMLIDANRFRDASGNVNMTYSASSGVTLAVVGPF